MTDVEQIFAAIQRLPVPDRLRIVERVVHELADASASPIQHPGAESYPSPVGLFADDPDAVDDMMETVRENRRSSRLREAGDDSDEGAL